MPMNKTNIEWCDYTWNPITGCLHNCEYCYARRFAQRGLGRYKLTGFNPTFHIDRLREPASLKRPSRIFAGSMGDLLGHWNWGWADDASEYRKKHDVRHSYPEPNYTSDLVCTMVASAMYKAPRHSYICLTKALLRPPAGCNYHPGAVALAEAGAWIGVSVAGDERIDIMATEDVRIDALIRHVPGQRKFISLEPIIGTSFLRAATARYWAQNGIAWVIIGGMTGPSKHKYPQPERDKVQEFVGHLQRLGIAVFVKDNFGYMADVREYPEGMAASDAAPGPSRR